MEVGAITHSCFTCIQSLSPKCSPLSVIINFQLQIYAKQLKASQTTISKNWHNIRV